MKNRTDLTQAELKRHFKYDPHTGEFVRILRRNGRSPEYAIHKVVTSKNNRGYYWTNIDRTMFLVHRLAFLYMTGRHPSGEVDHIDGDRLNNRWSNLRDVNAFENTRNQGNRKDNTSGSRGVHRSCGRKKKPAKWIARISHEGTRYVLGHFETKAEAVASRQTAEKLLGYHPNHARRASWRG